MLAAGGKFNSLAGFISDRVIPYQIRELLHFKCQFSSSNPYAHLPSLSFYSPSPISSLVIRFAPPCFAIHYSAPIGRFEVAHAKRSSPDSVNAFLHSLLYRDRCILPCQIDLGKVTRLFTLLQYPFSSSAQSRVEALTSCET